MPKPAPVRTRSRVLAALDALSDPIRARMVEELMSGPRSAKELAASAGVAPNRVYYHLGVLEAAGMVTVDGFRETGRSAERVYVATTTRLSEEGLDDAEGLAVASSLLETALGDLRRLVVQHADDGTGAEIDLRVNVSKRAVRRKDWQQFVAEVEAVLERFPELAKGESAYTVVFTSYAEPRR